MQNFNITLNHYTNSIFKHAHMFGKLNAIINDTNYKFIGEIEYTADSYCSFLTDSVEVDLQKHVFLIFFSHSKFNTMLTINQMRNYLQGRRGGVSKRLEHYSWSCQKS